LRRRVWWRDWRILKFIEYFIVTDQRLLTVEIMEMMDKDARTEAFSKKYNGFYLPFDCNEISDICLYALLR